MISAESVLAQVDRLPTFPAAFIRLSQLINDEETGADDFERALSVDPALTANVLRLANSAFFGTPRAVQTIRHAVTMLGTERVFEAASASALAGVMPKRLLGYGIDAQAFWRHSIAVAVLAEQLGAAVKLDPHESIFTAGLLHDIGKLVISVFLANNLDDAQRMMRDDAATFIEAEQEVLGTNHATVGGMLADSWKLPKPIQLAARWHHEPAEAPGDHILVDLVHIADGLAHTIGYGADTGELARQIDSAVIDRTGITVQDLERVACNTHEFIRDLGAIYDQVGDHADRSVKGDHGGL